MEDQPGKAKEDPSDFFGGFGGMEQPKEENKQAPIAAAASSFGGMFDFGGGSGVAADVPSQTDTSQLSEKVKVI